MMQHPELAERDRRILAEVVQAYIEYPNAERMPVKELKAFHRVAVRHGGESEVRLVTPVSELQKWDLSGGKWKLYPGKYKLVLGSHSRDEKLVAEFTVGTRSKA